MAEAPATNRFASEVLARREVDGTIVETFAAPDLVAVTPRRIGDARGFFSETWSRRRYAELGVDVDFVQDNHSFSATAGTIRGMHFQVPPDAQGKLVRVVRGAVLDVVVDIRHGSPAYGRPVAVELTAENGRQLYVPPGFAHAFCTLVPDTEILYRVTAYYAPQSDRGLAFDDPDLGIDWPVGPDGPVLSDKDRRHPRLRDLDPFFTYEARA
ncbi:MAG: dTDP-4-dehydrorhamnose 3,5-epimerase [Rhizobiales bacterium]|nr:dTDP-4-dehydrorhamnose 3,5-epimerase [Hyphomicrobiales bacterium]